MHVENIQKGLNQTGGEAEGLDPRDRLHEDRATSQQLAKNQKWHSDTSSSRKDHIGLLASQESPGEQGVADQIGEIPIGGTMGPGNGLPLQSGSGCGGVKGDPAVVMAAPERLQLKKAFEMTARGAHKQKSHQLTFSLIP